MTTKLYYQDPTTFEWCTYITKASQLDDHITVTLNETNFYPVGGGQPYDLGTIDGIDVVEVYEKNDEVFHVLKQMPEQKEVFCKVEKRRRMEHTQLHTGQHLLSAVCIELYNAHTVSFHLGNDMVSIDLEIPALSDEQLKNIEARVNQYIYENLKIKTYFISDDLVSSIPLRKIPEINGETRIVEIEGIDYSACCGTHVSQTGELGLLKLLKTEKHRGKMRLYFKCGLRALNDYQKKHEIINDLSKKLSTSKEDIFDRFIKLDAEKKDIQKKLDQALIENAKYIASEILNNQTNGPIIKTFRDKTFKEIQSIAMEVVQHTDQIVIFTSSNEKKIVVIHDGRSTIHCGNMIKENVSLYGGKGGGDSSKAQALFQNEQDLKRFLEYIHSCLNEKSSLLS